MRKRIAILDYGSQYTHLIARRIREKKVYSEVLPTSVTAAELMTNPPLGIILSGGPASVFAEGAPQIDPAIFDLGIPVLGICYGMQLMAHTLGGKVEPGAEREYGRAVLSIKEHASSSAEETADRTGIFAGLPASFTVWMSHGDRVAALPQGFETAATSAAAASREAILFLSFIFHPPYRTAFSLSERVYRYTLYCSKFI
ncbi:MAG: glutamine-hydrolyzing GMP synthase [Paludibacteraceae bacterium]|nr:glutamine-hydrolyzing GMP synthase [Paludibacteraceae bacterium]